MSTPLHLIVLAGGQGLRAGGAGEAPKQFRTTGKGQLFAVGLRTFVAPAAGRQWHVADVVVVAGTGWQDGVAAELADLEVPLMLALPGDTRTSSTWHAVAALAAAGSCGPTDLVAVHDAARPFATVDLLDRLAGAAMAAGGSIPGVPVPDTIVQLGAADGPAAYLDRQTLVAVQTPQVFRWETFAAAHQWAHEQGRDFTDDGGLLAVRGHHPVVVPGEPGNWKVTTGTDWERAADLLR